MAKRTSGSRVAKKTTSGAASRGGESNRPVYSAREGRWRLAVFRRGEEGSPEEVWHSCSISRSYKDRSDNWAYSSSFGEGDFDDIELLLSRARMFVEGGPEAERAVKMLELEQVKARAKALEDELGGK